MQQNGKVSKAFTLKLGHLNDFIEPATSTEKIITWIKRIKPG